MDWDCRQTGSARRSPRSAERRGAGLATRDLADGARTYRTASAIMSPAGRAGWVDRWGEGVAEAIRRQAPQPRALAAEHTAMTTLPLASMLGRRPPARRASIRLRR